MYGLDQAISDNLSSNKSNGAKIHFSFSEKERSSQKSKRSEPAGDNIIPKAKTTKNRKKR